VFDVHVHSAPDIVARIGYDDEIGQFYRNAEFSGFVLKGHHESTVGRAKTVARATGLDVVGGIVLNRPAGGINPAAVLSALLAGGRVVWFPTADAHTQESAGLPRLCDHDARIGRSVLGIPPNAAESTLERDVDSILDLIAEADALLCTGHLSAPECRWLMDRAHAKGIRRFLLTHPSYTVPNMPPGEIADLAAQGAFVEVTAYQLWHQPGMTDARLAEVARAAGDRLVLASDAGQPDSPPPPHALAELVDRMKRQGLDHGWIDAAASDIPRSLVMS
jgi:Family of unknown function (DUF6282)